MPRFRVLAGRHIEADKTKKADADGRYPDKMYGPGDVVDVDHALDEMFNMPGMPPKFERLHDDARKAPVGTVEDQTKMIPPGTHTAPPVTTPPQPGGPAPRERQPLDLKDYHSQLDRMSLKELQAHAAEEEIDLKGVTKREDVLRLLKSQH